MGRFTSSFCRTVSLFSLRTMTVQKISPVFSPDGSRIAYTGLENFNWNTYQIPVTGGESKLLLPNASGLTWVDGQRLLFSEIKTGAHMGLVTASESRGDEREVYLPLKNWAWHTAPISHQTGS